MSTNPAGPHDLPVNRSESIVSVGNLLYLLMSIGAFTGFAIALAYHSWQQGKPRLDTSASATEDAPRLDRQRGQVHV
jgi:hypothetical protein